MLRSFCIGALVGFFFGSSKQGHQVRDRVDGLLTDLISDDTRKKIDEKKDEVSEMANRSIAKFTNKTNGGSGHIEDKKGSNGDQIRKNDTANTTKKAEAPKEEKKSKDENFEPESKGKEEKKHEPEGGLLDVEKAQELADKLGAKPIAPEDENLSAFSHPDDELKSA